jgi:hypothetical protein
MRFSQHLSLASYRVSGSFVGGAGCALMLAILGASLLLTRKQQDFAAGLVLSLSAFKFHLFLFVPVLLLMTRRWRMVGGGVCGTAALTVLGMLVNGPVYRPMDQGVARSLDQSRCRRDAEPAWAGGGSKWRYAAGGDPYRRHLNAVPLMTLRTDNYELLLAASLVCGLLVSFHSTIIDDLALFPVLILVLGSSELVPLRALAGLILTPIPYFLVLAGPRIALFSRCR